MRVLLLLPTTSYRAPEFLEAAGRLRIELTVGAEERNVLTAQNPDGYLALDFDDPEHAAKTVLGFAHAHPIHAVLGVDDQTTVVAASIARQLQLPGNSPESVEASRDKRLMRERLQSGRVPIPAFRVCAVDEDPQRVGAAITYPCVLKPTKLAASQGVMRANDAAGFVEAWERLVRIVHAEKTAPEILIESFIPGREVALEGLVDHGQLRVLTLFDKPDPLDGPFFEETIYVRPSRLAEAEQRHVIDCATQAIQVLGLTTGPVHAELRINEAGVWLIEVAARPIGGHCSRALRFNLGISLEELVLRQALGLDTRAIQLDPTPSGVMMIPIPQAGTLRDVVGLDEATAVPGIEDVLLNTLRGQTLTPLPEGSTYLGFIFARASSPEHVEEALRQAHQHLRFVVEPLSEAGPRPAATTAAGSCVTS